MRRVFLLCAFSILAAGCENSNAPTVAAPVRTASAAAVKPDSTSAETGNSRAVAGEWPNWRGPRHDGISRETDWLSTWPEGGPAVLWKANVGTGFSSFSVGQGQLYTMGHRDGQDSVYCFDADSGEQVWQHSYACALVDNLHEGGPAATPTVDGERVYTVSKEGHLFCLHADSGKVAWKQELSPLLGVEMPEWGFSCSPLVLGDMLIVEAGRVVALDKISGDVIWQTAPYRPGYGSPVAFKHEGVPMITVLNNDCVLVVRTKDGSEVAKHPWETSFATTSTTPIVADDTIFISSGYQKGCALLKLAGGELSVIYENRDMANHMNNCVLTDGYLFGFSGNSHNARLVALTCMHYDTGEVKWQERGLGCGSLMMAGDQLIALSDEGELLTLKASTEAFEVVSRVQALDGRCWTVPVLAGGRIYCRNSAGDVVCLDVRNGGR